MLPLANETGGRSAAATFLKGFDNCSDDELEEDIRAATEAFLLGVDDCSEEELDEE